jgi:hypothetical protein
MRVGSMVPLDPIGTSSGDCCVPQKSWIFHARKYHVARARDP